MKTQTEHRIHSDALQPTDADLLDNPLKFIAEDHVHIRAVCAEMERLAQSEEIDPEEAHRILRFVTQELPLLVKDEDEDLFPLLLRRSEPDDDMRGLKARLGKEHDKVMALVQAITEAFERLAAGADALAVEDQKDVARFAMHMRRHLAFEDAIVLPFARLRLTARDLETLRLRMRTRRGL